jgi:predicted DCC family thiol-disulfide oxidoreductase YuxK
MKNPITSETKYILFVDGVCKLCNKFINFTYNRDLNKKIVYSSLQGIKYNELKNKNLVPKNSIEFIVIFDVQKNNYYIKSEAVRKILFHLPRYRLLSYLFHVVPLFVRDFIYTVIAKKRYSIFGKTNMCQFEDEIEQERLIK